jgi:tetratricopeptide (TPR) repeat protein
LSVDVWRDHFYARFGPPRHRGADLARVDHPTDAVERFIELGRPQPVFNNIAAGSHLLWVDAGHTTPYIDGRLLSADTFREYRSLLGNPSSFATVASSQGWRSVLLSLQPHAPVALFRYLYAQPQWQLMAFDASGALFVHQAHRLDGRIEAPAPIDLSRALPAPELPPARHDGFWHRCDPQPIAARGALLLQLGFAEAARSDLAQALQRCSSRWDIGLQLASALLDVGRATEALPFVERALRADAGRAEAWTNLGRIHASTGNWPEARACWQRALQVIPADPAAARFLQQAPPIPAP